MFTSQFKEDVDRVVEIDDFSFDTATHFFKFLYACVLEELSFSECVELFKMANMYQVTSLESRTKERMIKLLSKDNLHEALDLATDFDFFELRAAASKLSARLLEQDAKRAEETKNALAKAQDELARNWFNNYDGSTPLHNAARDGGLVFVKWLLKEQNAKVDATNEIGQTALHYGSCCGDLQVVKYLVEEKGAEVGVKDNDGRTPLHEAAWYGHSEVVKYFVEDRGEHFEAEDNDGDTPLDDARDNCHHEVVKYLEGRRS
eukprot:Selendium_serpulae@DN2033_c0_g1_i1.p1